MGPGQFEYFDLCWKLPPDKFGGDGLFSHLSKHYYHFMDLHSKNIKQGTGSIRSLCLKYQNGFWDHS